MCLGEKELQRSNLKPANEEVFNSSEMIQNIDYNNYYTQPYATGLIKPVKKKYKVKKTVSLTAVMFVIFATLFISVFVLPFAYKHFMVPVISNKNVNPFRVDISKIYSPTNFYLHNNEFLGYLSLIGAETKNPVMKELKTTTNMPKLEAALAALDNEYKFVHPSVFVWDYETGKYAAYNSQETFPAASIIKIPVLLQLFRSMELGQHNIDDKMPLTDYYRAEGSGDLQFQREGNLYTLDYLARKMIEISDNSSTNMLMSAVGGMGDVNRAVKSWGLKNTEINNWLPDMSGTNVTTTEDLARMLYNIENENFLSKESKEKILDYMGHVKNNRLIHAGLNPNAKFFHKTGDIGHTLGDAGIVVTPDGHKYIVCIMAKRPYNHPAGKDFTVRASEMIYNALASRNLA